jgi:GDP-L-fucose synthase
MTILVAGGSGFVGSNALEFLLKKNIKINATYLNNKPVIKSKNIRYIRADLSCYKTCLNLSKDSKYIYMFAGHVFSHASLVNTQNINISKNILINLNMAKAAIENKVKSYCWLSSSTGYPDYKKKILEQDFFKKDPPFNYFIPGWQSRFIEKIIYYYSKSSSSSTAIITIRPTEIFGEYDDFDYETCHALPAYIRRIVEARDTKIEKKIIVTGNFLKKKNYIYAKDLVSIIYKLMNIKHKNKYECFNICSKFNYSLKELLETIINIEHNYKLKLVFEKKIKQVKDLRRFSSTKVIKKIFSADTNNIENNLRSLLNWFSLNK